MSWTVETLAAAVNDWCTTHRVQPANGQAATLVTVRTLRYYRSVGVLDAPATGGGDGYARRHFLQACAVRVLQAQGLPLSRIQSLLFGRSDPELETILTTAENAPAGLSASHAGAPIFLSPPPPDSPPEAWQTWPLDADFLLVSRRRGFRLSAAQIAALRQILDS